MRERLLLLLTVVNLVILGLVLAERRPVAAQDVAPVLRGRALEIVDAQGRVRASIAVLPAERTRDGAGIPETVLLRLRTERGRPGIKISTSEEGSGFMAAGPTGTHQTYVTVGAHGDAATVRISNENGRQKVVGAE